MRIGVVLLALLAAGAAAAGTDPTTGSPEPTLLAAPGARELTPEALRERPAPFAAPVGERLRYAFSYWGVPLGTADLEVRRYLEVEGRRVAHVVAIARTHAAFDWLYRIRDRAEIWIDIDTLRTVQSRSWMEHSDHRVYEEIEFDWATHWVRVLRERRHSGRGRELVFDFGPFAHDPLDLVYTLRSHPALEREPVTRPVYASKKIRGLRFTARGREAIENDILGPVEAIRLKPEALLDGRPRGGEGRGALWVTAREPRIPLRLAGWFKGSDTFRVGGLRAELVGYVPHAPGWGDIGHAVAPAAAFRERPAESREGRPIWNAPEAVTRARGQATIRPGVRRFHFPARAEGGPYPRPEAHARPADPQPTLRQP